MIHDCRQCAGSRYVLVRTKGQATSLISPQEPFLGCSYNKKIESSASWCALHP